MLSGLWLPTYTLWVREMTRFYRQRSRVVGSLATPLLFWLFLGSGFGTSFRAASAPEGVGYLEYFYPGSLVLIVLFTSIFSTISIIEDRHQGFLQSVLVAPVPPASIVLGKVLGGATIALLQGVVFLCLAPALGVTLAPLRALAVVLVLFLVAAGLTALGFAFAWRTDSIQGFHAVMNLCLMPMWFLSGAVFPSSGAPVWLRVPMALDPLTYGVAAVRRCLWPEWPPTADVPGFAGSLAIVAAFGAVMFGVCVLAVRPKRPRRSAAVRGSAMQATLWIVLLLVLGLVFGAGLLGWLGDRDRAQGELLAAPDFSLVERSGRTVTLRDLRGRPWIADFVFTACAGPCRDMSRRMRELQDTLPERVRLVSISVDPERDRPEVLQKYAGEFGADPARWLFLTGEKASVRKLVMEGFFLPVSDTSGDSANAILHSEKFLLVDAKGRVRGYYDALEDEAMARLLADARGLAWIAFLPSLNAGLNAAAFVLLLAGWLCIRSKRVTAHRACMVSACGVSTLFLASYLTYHYHSGSTAFPGAGLARPAYFALLISHTVLAAALVPLVITTLARAVAGRFDAHRVVARWTLPIWLYVSATGVVVYWILYHMYAA